MSIQLGQKNKKSLPKVEQDIDPAFFEVKFKLNDRVFKIAVDTLLSFEEENLDEVSDQAFDKALDQCSYYRFTFLSAAVELEKKVAIIERQFHQWLAGTDKMVREAIIDERSKIKKETKVPNSWFGSITKQDMEYGYYKDPELNRIYQDHSQKISELRAQIKLMYGLRDVLEQRGNHLQSLGKRRLENQNKNFNV